MTNYTLGITLYDLTMPIEYCDLYDSNAKPIGKTILRGERPEPGEHYLAVHVWIRNAQGEYLIQKRSPEKSFPNIWAATSGAVSTGATSRETCQQEVQEELGVHTPVEDFRYIALWPSGHVLIEIWHVTAEIEIEAITLQPEEVVAAKWVDVDTLKQMIADGVFLDNGGNYFELGKVFDS